MAQSVAPGIVKATASKVGKFHEQYAPWISLGLGVLAHIYSKKDVDFAPKAVAIVTLAWLLPMVVARWLRSPAEGGKESRIHHLARTGSPVVTILLYKNVLFFLVPVWFGSATVLSINILAPLVLAAMALFTCFTRSYRESVLDRPRRRVLWTATVLFAALVPAVSVTASTSPRTSIMISAMLASAVAWAALAPRESILSKRGAATMFAVALPVAAVLGLVAPLLPPVPMVCHDSGAGIAVAKRELVGRADSFPAGAERVYAWFEVTLPKKDRQEVLFLWIHDGRQTGHGLRAAVQGGRKDGFRTWSFRRNPTPGSWRVDMLTRQSSQLIGRTRFEVTAP